MKELMVNEDLADITLITDDKKQIKANINILSVCSPLFKDILKLKKEKNSSPIIYLRGIQYSEMESIMQLSSPSPKSQSPKSQSQDQKDLG